MIEKINKSISSINNENCLLIGDFNFRNINWKDGIGTRQVETDFMDTIKDNLLEQIVTEPTRGKNVLDLAFVGDTNTAEARVCEVSK